MDKTTAMGVAQFIAAGLALLGMNLSPEDQGVLAGGWMVTHTILSFLKGYFSTDKK